MPDYPIAAGGTATPVRLRLKLTQGFSTVVDAGLPPELAWVALVRWHAHKSRSGIYARRRATVGGKSVSQFLHRVLRGTRRGFQTDHVNGDTLDNRLENLRNVRQSTNCKHAWRARRAKSGAGHG